MQFKVVIIEALPNEIVQGHEDFEKLSTLLTAEAKDGWSLKQVDSSWAQGYMIYTVVLQRQEPGDQPSSVKSSEPAITPLTEPPASTTQQEKASDNSIGVPPESLTGSSNRPDKEAGRVEGAEHMREDDKSDLPTAATWLASAVGLGVGVFLVFLGLITAITTSNSIAIGRSTTGGLLLPGASFTVGLVVMIFTAYKIGELAWRQSKG